MKRANGETSDYYQSLVGLKISGRYLVERFLEAGGSSGVFSGRDLQRDERVAVKVLYASNPLMTERFRREAAALEQLCHPNTLALQDFGTAADAAGSLFMVVEFLEGRSVRELTQQAGRLEPRRAVGIVSQVCRSLEEAHRHGIIHRDIKPSNICLIDRNGNPDFVKVLDFGIAKVLGAGEGDPDLTQVGRVLGTPRYMPPEQIVGGRVDGRADLYSTAVMLFELLCGRVPFEHENLASMLLMHLNDEPPEMDQVGPVGIPLGLQRAIRRALAKRPEDRQRTIEEFRSEIEAAVDGTPQARQAPDAGVQLDAPATQKDWLLPAGPTDCGVSTPGLLAEPRWTQGSDGRPQPDLTDLAALLESRTGRAKRSLAYSAVAAVLLGAVGGMLLVF